VRDPFVFTGVGRYLSSLVKYNLEMKGVKILIK